MSRFSMIAAALFATMAIPAFAQTPTPSSAPSLIPQVTPSIEVKKVTFMISMEELIKVCGIEVGKDRSDKVAKIRDLYLAKVTNSGEIQPTAVPVFRSQVALKLEAEKDKVCSQMGVQNLADLLDKVFKAEVDLASQPAAAPPPGTGLPPTLR